MSDINKLISRLAQNSGAIKTAPHPAVLSFEWMMVAVLYLAAVLLFSGIRADLMLQFQQPGFIAEIAALVGILVATSLSAALLSFPDLHQMRRVALAPALMFALFALIMFFAWRTDNPPAPLPEHTFYCTLSIAFLAVLPALGIFYAMRKFASTHYRWAGSIALLFAFSIGAIWLRLYEINDSIVHVIQWHYLPMAGFGIIGMWLGKIILKW